jgi:hypothetical protein
MALMQKILEKLMVIILMPKDIVSQMVIILTLLVMELGQ